MIQAVFYDATFSNWVVVKEQYFMVSIVEYDHVGIEYVLRYEGIEIKDVPIVRCISDHRMIHIDKLIGYVYPMQGKTLR
jgi:hypothetical protein